jgi:UDP-N-acetylglucosamine 1-carboxyvinyltransferase
VKTISMMQLLKIKGGRPLCGTVRAAGNKNAVLPMIAAALLTEKKVVLENVPDIGDVRSMLDIAGSLGTEIRWDKDSRILELQAANLCSAEPPRTLCSDIRAGILFAAPLVYRRGLAKMPPPGGDVIGRRRLDTHFIGLAEMGLHVNAVNGDFEFRATSGLRGADIFLPEASVTATEHLLLAAVVAEGETIIRNCACEPHVQDLCRLLQSMGAAIDGIGSNTLTIQGVPTLNGARHTVSSDYTEAGSFLALAAATGGEITVAGVTPEDYRMTRHVFRRLGIELTFGTDTVSVGAGQSRRILPAAGGGIPVIDDGPWPHFPSDLMSVSIVLATQLEGAVLFFEKMYESRMYFVDRLSAMGAHTVICDPHRVVVNAPARLHGIELSSPDIRAGIALLGAALCANGSITIRGVHLIDRGYEKIEDKLRALGADVERARMT